MGSFVSLLRWEEHMVSLCTLIAGVKSYGTYLLNFHFSPSWCKCSLIVSSLTLNLEASSWHVKPESDFMAAFKSSLFRDIGCPAQGSSSRVSLPQWNFWNQLRAVCSLTAPSPKAVHSLREAHDALVPSLNSYDRQAWITNFFISHFEGSEMRNKNDISYVIK